MDQLNILNSFIFFNHIFFKKIKQSAIPQFCSVSLIHFSWFYRDCLFKKITIELYWSLYRIYHTPLPTSTCFVLYSGNRESGQSKKRERKKGRERVGRERQRERTTGGGGAVEQGRERIWCTLLYSVQCTVYCIFSLKIVDIVNFMSHP